MKNQTSQTCAFCFGPKKRKAGDFCCRKCAYYKEAMDKVLAYRDRQRERSRRR